MQRTFSEKSGKIKGQSCAEKRADNGKKQTGEKTVQISGSKLKGLSGNDTDNNLQNLNSDIDEDTFELVLFKVGDDVVKRLKLIDKILLIKVDINRNSDDDSDEESQLQNRKNQLRLLCLLDVLFYLIFGFVCVFFKRLFIHDMTTSNPQ